jgi:hypothetical protein
MKANPPIYKTRNFSLVKMTKKSGKVYYQINMMSSFIAGKKGAGSPLFIGNQVRDIVDPTRQKSGTAGHSWKYRTLQEAESDFLMLQLMFTS